MKFKQSIDYEGKEKKMRVRGTKKERRNEVAYNLNNQKMMREQNKKIKTEG